MPAGAGTDGPLALRFEVEELLYHEADLLDRWELEDWLDLFARGLHLLGPARPTCPTPTRASTRSSSTTTASCSPSGSAPC